jgi:dihydrodiol dehydrogenase / D-xylose 1-dehydrogenase (NADP)
MSGKDFKWAVLGPGSIANRFATALAGVPGAVLYAVGSRDLGRAQEFASKYGAEKAYGSYEELMDDSNVDAFYIATPHIMHCENAIACLERGKPVLVEKPMSINAQFERRMAEAARRNNAFLMEAMWSRFIPAARHVRSLITSGAIGELRSLTADFSFSAKPDPEHRLFSPALAGGGILDVGIYVMAFTSMVFGPHPVEIAAFSHIGSTGVDEHAAMILKYPGGLLSSMTCGVHAFGSSEARIMGTEGRIDLSPFWCAQSLRVATNSGVEELSFPFMVNGFEYEIMEVIECVRNGLTESPTMPLDESIAIMEVLDGIRRQWGLEFPPEKQ